MVDYTEQKTFWENKKIRRSPTHPAVRRFAEPKVEYIKKKVNGLKNKTVLDVGCGNGFFTIPFSKKAKEVTGLDFSKRMLELNPHKKLVQARVEKMPFKDNAFDVVFCSNLLHHVKNPILAVAEMKRISKRFVVLSEPNRNNPLMCLFSLISKEERGALKFSPNYVKKLAEKNNMKIKACSVQGFVVPNKMPAVIADFIYKLEFENPFSFYSVIIAEK